MISNYLRNIQLVLFDVDDTLLYTSQTGWKKMNAVAKILKRPLLSENEFFDYYGVFSLRECVSAWFPNNSFDEVMYYYNLSVKEYPYIPVCMLDSIQEKLNQINIACGILTNGHENDTLIKKLLTVRASVENLKYIVGRESMVECKPSGAAFNTVLKDGWKNDTILYIGDAYTDWLAAKNANINFLGVCTGNTAWEAQSEVPYICSVCDFLIYVANRN